VAWQPFLLVAGAGALVILTGIVLTIVQLGLSIRDRDAHRDATGDVWNGRTLEWSTASPPPPYNFAREPRVESGDAWWAAKQSGHARAAAGGPYEAIGMPRNSPVGVFMAFFAVVFGFGMVWHIWWMAGVGLAGDIGLLIASGWRDESETVLPPAEVARIERAHTHGASPAQESVA
jgi:cytochrome o ubiquinol oxidase subunit 1